MVRMLQCEAALYMRLGRSRKMALKKTLDEIAKKQSLLDLPIDDLGSLACAVAVL